MMDQILEDFLKDDDHNARIVVGNRWLIWSGFSWMVYEQKPYAKKAIASAYDDIEVALGVLASED